MKFQNLSRTNIKWLGSSKENGIVISTRVRLARNLHNKIFPGKASREALEEIWTTVSTSAKSVLKNTPYVYKLSQLDSIDRQFLVERHLISHDHATKKGPRGVIFSTDETISIMVNEEDHIRMQVIFPEISLTEAWKYLNEVDTALNETIEYAFDSRLGYLTACPTNVGTGLRASCLLHLPGLVMTDEIGKLNNSLSKVGLNARGFYGEGTKPIGDIFQISNATSLGHTEEKIIENLNRVILTIVDYEKASQEKLKSSIITEDKIYRAYGLLTHCRAITSEEAMTQLSYLRLGLYLKMDIPTTWDVVNQLMFIIQPAHLQQIVKKELLPIQRDALRAKLIREKLTKPNK